MVEYAAAHHKYFHEVVVEASVKDIFYWHALRHMEYKEQESARSLAELRASAKGR